MNINAPQTSAPKTKKKARVVCAYLNTTGVSIGAAIETLTQANKGRYHFDYIHASKQQCKHSTWSEAEEKLRAEKFELLAGTGLPEWETLEACRQRNPPKTRWYGLVNYFICRIVVVQNMNRILLSIFFLPPAFFLLLSFFLLLWVFQLKLRLEVRCCLSFLTKNVLAKIVCFRIFQMGDIFLLFWKICNKKGYGIRFICRIWKKILSL